MTHYPEARGEIYMPLPLPLHRQWQLHADAQPMPLPLPRAPMSKDELRKFARIKIVNGIIPAPDDFDFEANEYLRIADIEHVEPLLPDDLNGLGPLESYNQYLFDIVSLSQSPYADRYACWQRYVACREDHIAIGVELGVIDPRD